MEFLHSDFTGGSETVVVVTVDGQCNVMLLDDINFSAYRRGDSFRYCGGWAKRSPVHLRPPHGGHWHVVVDLGGAAGQVRAAVRVVGA
jgi:hypothetical protein